MALPTIVTLLGGASCTASLTAAGKRVDIVSEVGRNCESLGRFLAETAEGFERDMRNSAGKLGATHVVFRSIQLGGPPMVGVAYKCDPSHTVTASLTAAGKRVDIVSGVGRNCESLGRFQGLHHGATAEGFEESAQDVRNSAGKLGATHVVFRSGGPPMVGDAYLCDPSYTVEDHVSCDENNNCRINHVKMPTQAALAASTTLTSPVSTRVKLLASSGERFAVKVQEADVCHRTLYGQRDSQEIECSPWRAGRELLVELRIGEHSLVAKSNAKGIVNFDFNKYMTDLVGSREELRKFETDASTAKIGIPKKEDPKPINVNLHKYSTFTKALITRSDDIATEKQRALEAAALQAALAVAERQAREQKLVSQGAKFVEPYRAFVARDSRYNEFPLGNESAGSLKESTEVVVIAVAKGQRGLAPGLSRETLSLADIKMWIPAGVLLTPTQFAAHQRKLAKAAEKELRRKVKKWLPQWNAALGGVRRYLDLRLRNHSLGRQAETDFLLQAMGWGRPGGISYYDAIKRLEKGATNENVFAVLRLTRQLYGDGREGALILNTVFSVPLTSAERLFESYAEAVTLGITD